METISDIYRQYKIPPNLEEHMLRVTGVAVYILENFKTNIDRDSIITTCLLHDMGNIIKFKLEKFPEFLEPEGLEYWQGVQNDFIKKYGDDEHVATRMICQELGVSDEVIYLIDRIGLKLLKEVLESDNLELLICNYADGRVGPHGTMSVANRCNDLFNRLEEKGEVRKYQMTREEVLKIDHKIEAKILEHCSIQPTDVNDESIAPIIESLRSQPLNL
jgi:hypothetical protein